MHVSRNCSDVLLLQNIMLCVFLNLWLISGIKEYPKSFLYSKCLWSNSLRINNVLPSPIAATTNACECLSLSRQPSSASLQTRTEHWRKGKCIQIYLLFRVFFSTFLIISCTLHRTCFSFQKAFFMKGRDLQNNR